MQVPFFAVVLWELCALRSAVCVCMYACIEGRKNVSGAHVSVCVCVCLNVRA
jgi:hypothetical protein